MVIMVPSQKSNQQRNVTVICGSSLRCVQTTVRLNMVLEDVFRSLA